MSLRILSFFIEGVTWRVAQTADGFFHWGQTEVPEWKAGIPSGVTQEIVESTFRQFSTDDDTLKPNQITFKVTYRIGRSNTECFIFTSPEGDLFSVKIPPTTFTALQEAFPTHTIPKMRVARIAVEQALSSDLPEVELLPGSPLFEGVKTKLSHGLGKRSS
ncbi:MAG: hypothetical protein KC563_04530 [Nitrospira sp.]|nr:hypothetical protein [Nitrospira sp.]MCB9711666.1 hypothetical protein [Nitrospiraceae bacterium]MDR4487652.1 hypothetical protein [Nitrospirales bacterium]MCA9467214.1 hypothetical protein [Nitrospira sp.]MCA9475062.1 hypothetical protein [Nitrospira sp.]